MLPKFPKSSPNSSVSIVRLCTYSFKVSACYLHYSIQGYSNHGGKHWLQCLWERRYYSSPAGAVDRAPAIGLGSGKHYELPQRSLGPSRSAYAYKHLVFLHQVSFRFFDIAGLSVLLSACHEFSFSVCLFRWQ